MKTLRTPLALVIWTTYLLVSCGGASKPEEKKVQPAHASTTEQRYTNAYFGISIEAPSRWFIKNLPSPKGEKPYQIALFQTMQYPLDSGKSSNANLYITAERSNHNPLLNDSGDYLTQLRDGLEMIASEGDEIGEIKPTSLGGKKVFLLETCSRNTQGNPETFQEFYATSVKDYWVLITLTYYTDAQKATLKKCLAGITFDQ